MERKELHLGPGAASLILVVVVVSMAILGLLSALQVKNDMRLTERSASMIEARYAASARAEQDLMQLDEAVLQARQQQPADDEAFFALLADVLPQDMFLQDNTVCWVVPAGDQADLICAVSVCNSDAPGRLTWVRHLFESHVGNDDME